jgi:hypothetical protein
MAMINNKDNPFRNKQPNVKRLSPIDATMMLLNKDDDIETKTEIDNPLALSGITLYQKYFEKKGLSKSSKTLETWTNVYLIYQISNKRKSRSEFVKVAQLLLASEIEESKKVSIGTNLAKVD